MNRTDWSSIKNIETISGKFKDGKEYRLFKDPVTGLIELIVDHKDLRNQNMTDKFQPVIVVSGFCYPND